MFFRWYIPSCANCCSCIFWGTGPFHLGYQTCGHRVVQNILLLCFSDLGTIMIYCFPFWYQDFVSFCLFVSFLSRLAWLEFYQLYGSFQSTSFWFHCLSLLMSYFQFQSSVQFFPFCSFCFRFIMLFSL